MTAPDLRETLARTLAEHPWHEPMFDGDDDAPHVNHQYYFRCAVCRCDVIAMAGALLPVVAAEVARQVAEAVDPVRALLDPQPQPCTCTERDDPGPGYILDENWSPEFHGARRSFTGYGYLNCPYCDDHIGNPGWRTEEPDLVDIRAALAGVGGADQAEENGR